MTYSKFNCFPGALVVKKPPETGTSFVSLWFTLQSLAEVRALDAIRVLEDH